MSESITHDLKRCINSRPAGFAVAPDQGVERTSNQVRRANGPRLFTPTSLDDDSGPESTFKRYPKHEELTATLHHLTPGAESLVCEPSAAIHYRDPALFVAGAAGITPSMAVLRDRARQDGRTQQSLRFSNKPPVDMVCEKELRQHPGNRGIFTYTATKAAGYAHTRIDQDFLMKDIQYFGKYVYVCGLPAFTDSVNKTLADPGVDPQRLVGEH